MIMVGVGTGQESQDSLTYDISNRNLGGVLLFAYNLRFPSQIRAQNTRFQDAADTPLFLATDQEGGIVARLDENNGYQRTYSAHELGTEFNSEDSTRKQAAMMAEWMTSAGLNMNLAPVVDVNVDPNSPAIGGLDRSFSSDESVVYQHASWFVDEFHKQNIATSLKHFPGHGSSKGDSHLGVVDVTSTWSEKELIPYKNLIDSNQVDAIMTAHIYNAKLDSTYPATMSKPTITGILRDSLGYNGLIFSDDMMMGAIRKEYGLKTAIRQTIKAGVDMLVFANNSIYDRNIVPKAHDIIKELIENGTISEQRINQSYNRIVEYKAAFNQQK